MVLGAKRPFQKVCQHLTGYDSVLRPQESSLDLLVQELRVLKPPILGGWVSLCFLPTKHPEAIMCRGKKIKNAKTSANITHPQAYHWWFVQIMLKLEADSLPKGD